MIRCEDENRPFSCLTCKDASCTERDRIFSLEANCKPECRVKKTYFEDGIKTTCHSTECDEAEVFANIKPDFTGESYLQEGVEVYLGERAEQMFWVHTRGLVVTLPPESTKKISDAVRDGNSIPSDEGRRLNAIASDSILRRRYKTPKDSQEFMAKVDYDWREKLYIEAENMTSEIVKNATDMGKGNIAVILFGSVAKGLVKPKDHLDPSNIDLAVIGEFTDDERDELFNKIREKRIEIGRRIGSNVGVHIQDAEKLRHCEYGCTVGYIGSSARALHDPVSIWRDLEKEGIEQSAIIEKCTLVDLSPKARKSKIRAFSKNGKHQNGKVESFRSADLIPA